MLKLFRSLHSLPFAIRITEGVLVASLGVLAGCPSNNSGSSASPSPTAQTSALGGALYGGRQPINQAAITVYEANPTAGAPATPIGTAITGPDGKFSIATLSPAPASGAIIYVTATGGDATGGNPPVSNGNVRLATVADIYCTSSGCGFPDFVNINELTTTATVYSMAGFMDLSGGSVSISGTSPGLPNAAKTFAHLVSAASGKPTFQDPAACIGPGEPIDCTALRKLDTLANIAAVCVNAAAPYTACTGLFAAATPDADSPPTNTLAAFLNVVTKPAVRNNAQDIYALKPDNPIFAPALVTAPNAWVVALYYSDGGLGNPLSIAVDANGNVWVAGIDSVSKFGPTGSHIQSAFDISFGVFYDIAIDASGHAWTVSRTGNKVYDFIPAIYPYGGGYTGGGLSEPEAIAIDGSGNVWTASAGNTTVNKFGPSGAPLSGTGYTGGGLDNPGAIAIDSGGHVWVASRGNSSLNEFDANGNPLSSSAGYTGGGLDYPTAIAIDPDGNVWAAGVNVLSSKISEFDGNGNPISGDGYSGGGYVGCNGGGNHIAIDADGNVWTASCGNNTVNEFDANGNPLSPSAGYIGGRLILNDDPGIAVDSSGNLWVANYGSYSIAEFIGMAAPTRTPIVEAITQGFTP